MQSQFVPGSPTNVNVLSGNSFAILSWAAPTNTGESSIVSYTILDSTKTYLEVSGNITNATISPLTNGTSYTFYIYATNQTGHSGSYSDPLVVTPATVPGSPTNIVATAGNSLATVSWTVPTNTGGSPITSYVIEYSGPTGPITMNATSTPATVNGLTNGTSYIFKVSAKNAVGSGSSSDSNNVTPSASSPVTVPGPPTGVVATPGNSSATVTWTAPTNTGGSPITSYEIMHPGGPLFTSSSTSVNVTGLTNGNSYTFTVLALNSHGKSVDSSPSAAITPITLPQPPTNVVATSGNLSATITWTAPTNTGGSPITSYTIKYPGISSDIITNSSSTMANITGLTNGTSYTFTVASTNSVGTSGYSSSSVPVVPAITISQPPTNVVAVPGNSSAYVTWRAPTNNGGSTITSYQITYPGYSGSPITTSSTNIIINGLTNGTSYTFTIAATNSSGKSSFSNSSSSIIPLSTIPQPPTNVVAVAGDSLATITWTAPTNNGGSPIIGYEITYPGGDIYTNDASTTITITRLTNGTSYTFEVSAITAIGQSIYTSSSTPVTPLPASSLTVPNSPTNVVAVAGNSSATISWTPPTNDGGSPITNYEITYPGAYSNTITDSSSTTITVTNLPNGSSYTFTVAAFNAVGRGNYSSSSNSITLESTVPQSPINVVAVAGNSSATVSWTTPVDGGSPITDYQVTYSGPTGPITMNTTSTTATVNGLTNGTSYTFKVLAKNAVGSGSSSDSNAVTPSASSSATVPGPPTGVIAVPGNSSATVTWTAPANNGGSPITSYEVEYSGLTGPITMNTTSTTATVNGLTNGTSYTFKVLAKNAVGSGSSTDSNAVTPSASSSATVPGPPTGVVAVPGNSSATVSWTAPANNGGSTISSYEIMYPGGPLFTSSTTSVNITGLTNGNSYTFTVYALNAVGKSVVSSPSAAVTPSAPSTATVPGSPTNVVATAGNSSATVTWTAPANNGGSSITYYEITYSGYSGGVITSTSTNATITGLTNGTSYTFKVLAKNASGTGNYSSDSNAVTPSAPSTTTVPGSPTNVVATAGDSSATVTWTAPANNGGSPITGYKITYSGNSGIPINITSTTATVTGLTNGASYTFIVAATNAIGTGSFSSNSNTIIPESIPIVCFAKGTRILTEKGYVQIEDLNAGTLLFTNGRIIKNEKLDSLQIHRLVDTKTRYNYPKQPIKWISSFTVDKPDKNSYPICLQRGSIYKHGDEYMPSSDLYVSPEHSICVKNKMIPAKLLVNDQTIFQDTSYKNKSIEYYHIEMPYHCAIISNGLLTESYLDSGNRGIFKDKGVQNKRQTIKQFIQL